MYDPNQPRIPEGHHGGGRWTRRGHAFLSDVGKPRVPSEYPDDAPHALDDRDLQSYDLHLPSDLDRMALERGNPRSSAQNPQYALLRPRPGTIPVPIVDIPSPPTGPRRPEFDPAAIAVGAWAFFRRLSIFNNPDQTAIIGFKAHEFERREAEFEFDFVRVLNRQQVKDVCKDLETVQDLVDQAVDKVGDPEKYKAAKGVYGTAAHFDLQQKVMQQRARHGFDAEVSFAVDGRKNVIPGEKDSIRVDIFKRVNRDTICIYDLKTLNAQLTPKRMREIADYVFRRYGVKVKRIVVVEVKPGEGP
jgi:hypothetical protein